MVQAISASGRHDLAPLADRTVMSWGDNTAGQLGNGTTSAVTAPSCPSQPQARAEADEWAPVPEG